MASEYCSMKEVCDGYGLSEQEVRAMVADGRIREYRDAGKVFFKRSEVEKIAAKQGSSIVDLVATEEPETQAPSYDSALSSLADSSSSLGLTDFAGAEAPAEGSPVDLIEPGSGSSMGLSPTEMQAEDFPQELPAAPKVEEPVDLTAELSSEIDLLPSGEESSAPRKPSAAAPPDLSLSSSSVISLQGAEDEPPVVPRAKAPAPEPAKPAKSGISVFDDDEIGITADPMGETRISAGVEELEAVGGGSGLLDLTQVNDDTSLGAELLDVISPTESGETQTDTETEVQSAAETMEDSGSADAMTIVEASPVRAEAGPAVAVAAPRVAARSSEMRGAIPINITLVLGMLCLALVGLATAAQLQGVWPGFLNLIARDVMHWSVFGGLALAAIVTGILGILADRG